MSDFEGTMRGLAFLGSPQGDGVGGDAKADRSTSGCFPIKAENLSGVCATGRERPHDESPADSEFNVADVSPVPSSAGGEVLPSLASSPLQKFDSPSSQEHRPLFQPLRVNPVGGQVATAPGRRSWQVPDAVNESGRGESIQFQGTTIERLILAVVVCEERAR